MIAHRFLVPRYLFILVALFSLPTFCLAADLDPIRFPLTGNIVDAEFNAGTDQLVFVSSSPSQIHRWDASTSTLTSLALPFTPTCVSISPDGSEAVVGHNANVSRIELNPLSLVGTQSITAIAGDIVHAGNGYAYVFPSIDQWVEIHCLHLDSGIETTSSFLSIRAGTRARLLPGTTRAYGADNGLSPADIERYDFSAGTASVVRDSPYHGTYAMGGDLWFNDAGTRILTRSGNVFRSTSDASTDMTYAGTLGSGYLVQADHGGSGDGQYAVITSADDTAFRLYDTNGLSIDRVVDLPDFSTIDGEFAAHGKWIFVSQDGLTAHVITKADVSAGLVDSFAIDTFDITPPPAVTITTPTAGNELGTAFDVFFVTKAWPPITGGSVTWSLDGVDQGSAVSPIAVSGLPAGAHTIAVLFRDDLGDPTTVEDSIDITVITSLPDTTSLPVEVVDAEFHAGTDRLIFVSANPPQIHRWDAATRTHASLDLLLVPTCISISPDGSEAVIGHDSAVTRVDLNPLAIVSTQPIAAFAGDIVHGGNGFAYIFPSVDQWVTIHCLALNSGNETSSSGTSIRAGTRARLLPGTTLAYGADNGLSPADIERYDFGAGAASVVRDSPYHGDYGMGGDLWFNDAGTQILTRSGNVFRSTNNVATDMTYAGALGSGYLVQADHGGSGDGQFAVITTGDDTRFSLYDSDGLNFDHAIDIPDIPTITGTYEAHGKWVFISQDGLTAHVIAKADPNAGLLYDYAIDSFDITPQPTVTITTPTTGSELGNVFDVFFATKAWPPIAGGSVSWSLDGVDQGSAVSPISVTGLAAGAHTIAILLRDDLNDPTGVEDSVDINVMDTLPNTTRLQVAVVDAEFHATTDRLIFVSANPPQVHSWNAATRTLTSLNLPSVPTCISISPDGSEAVIGHNANVTRVDLNSLAIVSTQPITAIAGDIVHGGNGFAYVFPSVDQWVKVHCLELDSGVEITPPLFVYAGTRARLLPGTTIAYGADKRFDFSAGTASVVRNSPYYGAYGMGGDLWFNDAGTRILARSGNVFRSTSDVATDMTYAGTLGSGNLVWADHGGTGDGQFAVIPTADDTRFSLYDSDGLRLDRAIDLPDFPTLTGTYAAHGKWIFLSQDGLTAHILAQAEPAAGLINDFVIDSFDITPQPDVTITTPTTGSELGNGFDVFFNTKAWPPITGGSVSWSLDGVDQGSAVSPISVTGLAAGAHTIAILLRDDLNDPTGVEDSVDINVMDTLPDTTRLPVAVVDAEFQAGTDRLIFVSADPPQVHSWNAATRALTSLDLPSVPTCISISPNGSEAVIGHNATVTRVDLNPLALVSTQAVTAIAGDIVHGGNGFAYVFPSVDQWVEIHCLELNSGVETLSWTIRAGTLARLLPGTAIAYGADNGLSPSDIERYDLSAGTASYVRDSPYHGDYAMGGDLWFNDAGTLILTRTGNVFRSTNDIASDMTYAGTLGSAYLVQADHGGSGDGQFAVITSSDTHFELYDTDGLRLDHAVNLPAFPTLSGTYDAHGKWIFLSQDGLTAHVITQADPAAGLINDFSIDTFDITPQPAVTITTPTTGSELGSVFDVFFTTKAWPPIAGGSVTWSLDSVDQGLAVSPIAISSLAAGAHTITVVLRDDLGNPTAVDDSINITVLATLPNTSRLPVDVVDAEFHAGSDRLIFISSNPPQVHSWNAGTRSLTSLDLPFTPTCISISPDGSEAVIGHNANVTRVGLNPLTIVSTQPVSAIAGDIVHGGNGFAYVFPSVDQWVSIHCLELDSGNETTSSSSSIRAGTHARLLPGTTLAYGADNGLSPSDIERYDLSAGTASVVRDSPYHGDYAMGGDLWFTDTGTYILTRSGNVFRSTNDVATDMTYAGALSSNYLVQADHGGSGNGQFAVITASDTHFELYDTNGLRFDRSINIPNFPTLTGTHSAHGKWIFVSQDGLSVHVITKADPSAGLINDYAINTFDITPQPDVTITTPSTGSEIGGAFSVFFTTKAWPPIAGGSITWSLDGVNQGSATSPISVSGLASGAHTISVLLRDNLGNPTGVDDAITVQRFQEPPGSVRLPMSVVDAEFNAVTNNLILVSANPPQIHSWNTATKALISLDLPLEPTCISISPNGSEAVVGHNAKVTRVSLKPFFAIVSTQSITAIAGDIVHGGNGFAYVFPSVDQWVEIHSLQYYSGVETTSWTIRAGTRARLLPGTSIAYGADNGLSPSDIERYDLSAGTASVVRDSPYHGDYGMGGDLWFNDSGTQILTRSGNVFHSSNDVVTDMTYAGTLGSGYLVQADHGGTGDGQFAVITTSDDTRTDLYDAASFAFDRFFALPSFPSPSATVASHGRWVFISQDGHKAHVIVRADPSAGFVNPDAIYSYNLITNSPDTGSGSADPTPSDPASCASGSGFALLVSILLAAFGRHSPLSRSRREVQ